MSPEEDKLQKSMMVVFPEKHICKEAIRVYLCIYTNVLYEYMISLWNYVFNLVDNTHVRIKIYQEFYHSIIYIANLKRHVRMKNK